MGFRSLCRSSHCLLEPLRIILAQLKETPLLQQAHRRNLAEGSLQKYFQQDFGSTSGQYFGTILVFLPLISLMGHFCPIHLRTSCIHPRRPFSESLQTPSLSLRNNKHQGQARDEAKTVTRWKPFI